MEKKKRSVLLFIASVIAIACFVYTFSYMGNTASEISGSNSAESIGKTIGLAIATPHLILSGLGTLFCVLGWALKKRGFALTAGILFAVAIFAMPAWFMFVIVQMLLCFIAFGTMKK